MSQPMEALALANEIRSARAALRREVFAMSRGDGMRRLAEILRDPPACIDRAPIIDVLAWPRRWGHQRVTRILFAQAISQTRRVEALTERQRNALATVLELEAIGK